MSDWRLPESPSATQTNQTKRTLSSCTHSYSLHACTGRLSNSPPPYCSSNAVPRSSEQGPRAHGCRYDRLVFNLKSLSTLVPTVASPTISYHLSSSSFSFFCVSLARCPSRSALHIRVAVFRLPWLLPSLRCIFTLPLTHPTLWPNVLITLISHNE